MTCKELRGSLSPFVDRALPPKARQEITLHLTACASCQAEYRAFQGMLQQLKLQPRATPPAGLESLILAKLPAVSAPGTRKSAGVQRWPWAVWATAALMLLAVGLVAFLARERRWQERLDRALAQAEEAAQVRLEAEARVMGQRRLILEQALADEKAVRREAEQAGKERFAALEAALADRAGELESLRDRLLAHERAAAELAARVLAPPPQVRDPEPALAIEPPAPGRVRTVALRRVGDRLELSVRGAKDVVVPELFAMARDPGNSEVAALAEKTLENMIDAPVEEPAVASPQGGWFQERIESVAAGLGIASRTQNVDSVSVLDRRQERLRALERAWSTHSQK